MYYSFCYMDIPTERWYEAIFARRSRRNFDPERQVEKASLAAIEKVCLEFRPFACARTCLINKPGIDVFKGIAGSYGKVKGSAAFIAMIGDMNAQEVQEAVGYTGEGVILEAAALGLDTCWVGGLFSKENTVKLIKIADNERVLAVSPLGYARENISFQEKVMIGFGRTHQRLPLSKLVTGQLEYEPADWQKAALEAARQAPSAVNRQPWRFNLRNAGVMVSIRTPGQESGISKRLDCGIAMLHLETAALAHGVSGYWKYLPSPDVARFEILNKMQS